MNITLSLPDDIPVDLQLGGVYQLAPIFDDRTDAVVGYWIFDEHENPVVVVPATAVRIER
jgi:hypothetical protein